ncbi:MoaD/ThiS family protein [Chitinibacter fontanus]|uniref:Molybdopterin synthase sulfur carrier subunit n=1 Tax=Chitinibacter fontanus TaxID=1737446 RepID=A0A7D5ZGU1_9NEIS|nr:MoaD/ThiS family protein [Chitinibacter fontanus]QLI82168.1 MoaD/ThiS family protein [Chitinibacter fontanus]
MLTILYFARLREVFACQSEILDAQPATVRDLIAQLVARGGAWQAELGGARVFRVAINQEMAQLDDLIPVGAEVAIFPPVTGG